MPTGDAPTPVPAQRSYPARLEYLAGRGAFDGGTKEKGAIDLIERGVLKMIRTLT